MEVQPCVCIHLGPNQPEVSICGPVTLMSTLVQTKSNTTCTGKENPSLAAGGRTQLWSLPAADPGEDVAAMLGWRAEKLQDAVRVLQLQVFHQRTRNSL